MASSSELLRLAAGMLEDGRDPLTTAFLSEHDVTFEQCMSLAEQLALGARIMAEAIERPRSTQGVALMMTLAARL